ncbi:MAG TPA: hypothetical protein GX521_10005, partial [Firmicutes bacterium]|nr:hypothetical protein [Bacillota bacterium]
KPGGHLLAFGGTRTYHRMACAIEDAGFIIHPMIAWINSQGFPKATNLSKQFDKQAGAKRKVVGKSNSKGIRSGQGNYVGDDYKCRGYPVTAPTTPKAKQWDGWHYGLQSLKPAVEPVCMAQKPIDGKRMTDNVLKWGVGAINVDGCRIGTDIVGWGGSPSRGYSGRLDTDKSGLPRPVKGRFPANVIFDEEAGELLDKQSGISISRSGGYGGKNPGMWEGKKRIERGGHNDSGGASRFFYCSKASKKERGEGNKHPTVKPLKLMRYLCRLVTPPNGIVLDPFAGSGTTLLAAKQEGFSFIGIEKEKDYVDIAEKRLQA